MSNRLYKKLILAAVVSLNIVGIVGCTERLPKGIKGTDMPVATVITNEIPETKNAFFQGEEESTEAPVEGSPGQAEDLTTDTECEETGGEGKEETKITEPVTESVAAEKETNETLPEVSVPTDIPESNEEGFSGAGEDM